MTYDTQLRTIAETFAADVAALDGLDDRDRVRSARRLAELAHSTLAPLLKAVADEGTYVMTRVDTQPSVAGQLGVSKSAVEQAVTRHRARLR